MRNIARYGQGSKGYDTSHGTILGTVQSAKKAARRLPGSTILKVHAAGGVELAVVSFFGPARNLTIHLGGLGDAASAANALFFSSALLNEFCSSQSRHCKHGTNVLLTGEYPFLAR